ncbi:oxaloacetate decarboxylase subunit gamma [Gayadomonas joobiniege]|uniref:oxaloacetate decarboxylase subunit gamma n=1 Tax=Gayadomonas joobiniege TaxID=1234606 RepID=UPI00036E0403|nr:oxaloacetate decarboxylase subunit gamma [Gayadomonas joobiniege]
MENNLGALLFEAANLLLIGMGVVFIFLTILIFLIKLMSSLVGKNAPTPAAPVATPNINRNTGKSAQDKKVVAAISAAVHQYRQDNK